MKDLFKLYSLKRKINLVRFFFFFFCQGIVLCLKTMLDEIRKNIFNYFYFSLLSKNIRTGGSFLSRKIKRVQFIPICSLFPGIIKIRRQCVVLEITLVFIV